MSALVRRLSPAMLAVLAAACGSLMAPPYQPSTRPQTVQPAPAPGPSAAAPPTAAQPQQPPPEAPAPVPAPPQPSRQYHLGVAASALVEQARQEAASGNPDLARATLERALRIEPDNPLLWTLLGEEHESTGQYALAGSMGHKALQLASGDVRAQAAAWRLIGDSLRARGRNVEANEAYSHADTLAQ